MDLSAIIVVVALSGAFFGFVLWAAFQSRKSNSEKISADNSDIKFSEVRKHNEQFLKE